MSEIRVNVEGAPEAVAKFFKEMGQTKFIENHVKEDRTPLNRIGDMKIAVNVDAEAVYNKITEKVSQDIDSKNDELKEEKKTRKPRQKKEDKVEAMRKRLILNLKVFPVKKLSRLKLPNGKLSKKK